MMDTGDTGEKVLGMPVPPIDLFKSIVDILAKRYGWSYDGIGHGMYWEDVYEMYEYAANMNAVEKSEDMRFQFMLHATSKEALDNWKDLEIPFPRADYIQKKVKVNKDKKRRGYRPENSKLNKFLTTAKKMTPAQRERFEYVKKRLAEHKKRQESI